MHKSLRWIRLGALLSLVTAVPAFAQVTGRIERVGLAGGGAQLVRIGTWTVIEVRLAYRGAAPFSGALEVQQADRDGDMARYRAAVALAPDAPPRSFELYFVPGTHYSGGVSVRLLDAAGEVVPIDDGSGQPQGELVSAPIAPINSNHGVILDLSEPRIALLRYDPKEPSGGVGPTYEPRWKALPLDPRSLPVRWMGLEMADVIVWDDPDVTQLQPAQIDALVEWVRHGGRLVCSASRNWQTISASGLADLLPATISGATLADEVQEFTERIVADPLHEMDAYFALNPVTRCKMTPLPGAAGLPTNPRAMAGLEPIAYRRNFGRGTVTLLGASLRELLAPIRLPVGKSEEGSLNDEEPPIPENPTPEEQQRIAADKQLASRARQVRRALFGKVLGVRTEEQLPALNFRDIELHDLVRATVGFQSLGAAYLGAALLFAAGYVLAATFGIDVWLTRRKMRHHNWSIFCVVAVAGSLVGVGAVMLLRGVSTRLQQTTVVDAGANQSLVVADALFGVKTPTHARLDVRLPAGLEEAETGDPFGGQVRVLPASDSLSGGDSFVAPESYLSLAGGESIERLPVRATLKELEGAWEGLVEGRLEGQLRTQRFRRKAGGYSDRFVEGTFLRNRLGVDLQNCILLDTLDEFSPTSALQVRVFELGTIAASGSASELNETSLHRHFFKPDPKDASREVEVTQTPDLTVAFRQWINVLLPYFGTERGERRIEGLDRVGSARTAMLLLSVLTLYDPVRDHPSFNGTLVRGMGRRMDCLHQLRRDQAILIGFSDQPGPVSLSVNNRRLRPGTSTTMYRFVIPVERLDSAE